MRDGLGPLAQAYPTGNLAATIMLTFAVNPVLGSSVMLTVPSAGVPLGGMLVVMYRAIL